MAFEGFDGEGMCFGGHDDEGDDGHFGVGGFEAMVEAGEGFDEHIDTFVTVFIASRGEEIEGVVWFKVIVAIEVAAHKVVDLLLVYLM